MASEEKDIDLITKVKEKSCNESLKTLIGRHTPLCFNIYKKYHPALSSTGFSYDDIKSEKDYIIYNSILKFNPSKNVKFSTWLGNFTRYYCLNLINSKKRYICLEDEKLNYYRENSSQQQEDGKDFGDVREYVIDLLSKMKDVRIKKVFMLRYFSETKQKNTWQKIGKRMNISTQTAINLHEKGRRMLSIKFKSKQFSELI